MSVRRGCNSLLDYHFIGLSRSDESNSKSEFRESITQQVCQFMLAAVMTVYVALWMILLPQWRRKN